MTKRGVNQFSIVNVYNLLLSTALQERKNIYNTFTEHVFKNNNNLPFSEGESVMNTTLINRS